MERDPNWTEAKGIGDINSNEKGSGARFNSGKPAMELLPLREVATLLIEPYMKSEYIPAEISAISYLAAYQEGADNGVYQAMAVLGDPQETLVECAQVFDYGKRKYAEWNWAKGMNWSIPLACAVRHLLAMLRGEWIDPIEDKGSGLPHRGHVMCNLMMLATYLRTFREGDDRPKQWLASTTKTLHFTPQEVEAAKD